MWDQGQASISSVTAWEQKLSEIVATVLTSRLIIPHYFLKIWISTFFWSISKYSNWPSLPAILSPEACLSYLLKFSMIPHFTDATRFTHLDHLTGCYGHWSLRTTIPFTKDLSNLTLQYTWLYRTIALPWKSHETAVQKQAGHPNVAQLFSQPSVISFLPHQREYRS